MSYLSGGPFVTFNGYKIPVTFIYGPIIQLLVPFEGFSNTFMYRKNSYDTRGTEKI